MNIMFCTYTLDWLCDVHLSQGLVSQETQSAGRSTTDKDNCVHLSTWLRAIPAEKSSMGSVAIVCGPALMDNILLYMPPDPPNVVC